MEVLAILGRIYIFIVEIVLDLIVLFTKLCCYFIQASHSFAHVVKVRAQLSNAMVQFIKETCDFLRELRGFLERLGHFLADLNVEVTTWTFYFQDIFFFGELGLPVFVLIELFVVLLGHKLLEVRRISEDWKVQQ